MYNLSMGILDKIKCAIDGTATLQRTLELYSVEAEQIIASAIDDPNLGYRGAGYSHGDAAADAQSYFIPPGKEVDVSPNTRVAMTSKGRIVSMAEAYQMVHGEKPPDGHILSHHDIENVITDDGLRVAGYHTARHNTGVELKLKNEHARTLSQSQMYDARRGMGD